MWCTVQAWRTVGYRGTHSLSELIKMTAFSVKILPALQDNYMYLVSALRMRPRIFV